MSSGPDAKRSGGEPDRQEMDIILLLSQRAVYVAWYDDDEEQITQYQRIYLEDIEEIEIGAEPTLFKSKSICMRLHYRYYADEGFFHSFRAPSTRLFNNIVINVRNQEEAKESLSAVCQSFAAAQQLLSLELSIVEKQKLDRKKTLPHPEVQDVHQQLQENALSHIKLPRDISSSDIPSSSSSRGPSPVPFRNTQTSSSFVPTTNNILRPESADSKKSRVLSPSSITKGLLSSLPKVNKNISLNANFDISVPKINLKPTNLVNKLKTGGAAVKLFTKQTATRFSASYKKHDEVDSVFTETVVVGYPMTRERQRTLSRDDSTIDDGSELVDADIKEEVILDSCGILATNTKQIFESPQYSFDELDTGHVKHLSKSCEESVCAIDDEHIPYEAEAAIKPSRGGVENTHIKTDIRKSDVQIIQKTMMPVIQSNKDTKPVESTVKAVLTEERSNNSGFHCFCEEKENCPHSGSNLPGEDDTGPVWVLQGTEDTPDAMQENPDLNLGQKRVIDNSEADRILEKYSTSKQALNHPSLRISFSDSAIASNNVTRSADQSPKSVLDSEMEINTALQMKLPNLLQSSKMSRKSQRIYDNLKKHIQQRLGDNECQSTIIFI